MIEWTENRRNSVREQLDELIDCIDAYSPLGAAKQQIADTIENLIAGVNSRDVNCYAALDRFCAGDQDCPSLMQAKLIAAIEGSDADAGAVSDWRAD